MYMTTSCPWLFFSIFLLSFPFPFAVSSAADHLSVFRLPELSLNLRGAGGLAALHQLFLLRVAGAGLFVPHVFPRQVLAVGMAQEVQVFYTHADKYVCMYVCMC